MCMHIVGPCLLTGPANRFGKRKQPRKKGARPVSFRSKSTGRRRGGESFCEYLKCISLKVDRSHGFSLLFHSSGAGCCPLMPEATTRTASPRTASEREGCADERSYPAAPPLKWAAGRICHVPEIVHATKATARKSEGVI